MKKESLAKENMAWNYQIRSKKKKVKIDENFEGIGVKFKCIF